MTTAGNQLARYRTAESVIIAILGRLRQEELKVEASLDHLGRSCLK